MLPGIVMDVILVRAKAPGPSFVRPFPKLIVERLAQSSNAHWPMFVTLFGIVMLLIFDDTNELPSIETKDKGKVIWVREEQP